MTRWTLIAAATLSVVACRGDDVAGPGQSGSTLATSATTALTFRQISAGSFHTCGVTTTDQAYCWGPDYTSALGGIDETRPFPVPGGLRFRTVNAGANRTCGLTTGGRAYCWGDNFYGEVGDGTTTLRLVPVPVLGGLRFRQLDAGEYHTCGLTDPDRRLYCWGQNLYGQLGDGTKLNRSRPVAVLGGRVFRQVSAGGQHTCAITTTDQAYCWGDNRFGQLGDGTTVLLRSRPALVAGGRLFSQLDGGRLQTCAVNIHHRAFCWGSNFPNNTPLLLSAAIRFDRVSASVVHACGEASDNRTYCWGDNSRGQLGDGTTVSTRLVPVAVVGGLTFAQVSASVGGLHTCGMTGAGRAYCWGNNSAGGLGDGTMTNRLSPVAVLGPP